MYESAVKKLRTSVVMYAGLRGMKSRQRKAVFVFGVSEASHHIINELRGFGIRPVGVIDNDERKQNMFCGGVPVIDVDALMKMAASRMFFYSKNLKKFTEELVYIPYFVLEETKPDEDKKIEGIKHFCTLPGVFNADRVIVQSEDMRQVYIKVLADYTNDHSENARKYWEEKILGSGSPKFDKVADTKREDIKIPVEWMEIIRKPDGSWKKVIFYNTSIGALLQHDEKVLAKIKDVLRIFKENQDEIALLWRPHPLIKATMESMRPQLCTEYDMIVRNYIEEGWGIYDDTADVSRAVAISDAYYGDESSVVQVYQKVGKPVMIQDVKISGMAEAQTK